MKKFLKWLGKSLLRDLCIFVAVLFGVVTGLLTYEKCQRDGIFDEYFEEELPLSNVEKDKELTSACSASVAPMSYGDSAFKKESYETANLLNYDYNYPVGITQVNNVTLDIREDGRIYVSSTASSAAQWIRLMDIPNVVGGLFHLDDLDDHTSYTVSGSFGSVSSSQWRLCYRFYPENFAPTLLSSAEVLDGSFTFVPRNFFGNNYAKVETMILYLYVGENQVLDNQLFEPMLNKGDTAYPYTPSMKRIYDTAYNDGYDEARKSSKAGVFAKSTYDITLYGLDDGINNENVVIDSEYPDGYAWLGDTYIYGGIDLTKSGLALYNMAGDWSSTQFKIKFDIPVDLAVFETLQGVGSPLFFSMPFSFLTEDNFIYYGKWIDKGNSIYSCELPSFENTSTVIDSLIFRFDGGYESWDFSLYVDSSYLAGHVDGYNEGFSDGEDVGYDKGKLIAQDEAFQKGKVEGFNQATKGSDPYGFIDFAFAILDMPGRIIYNLLNFEFLGYNLAGLVATLLSIFIVGWVLHKVT